MQVPFQSKFKNEFTVLNTIDFEKGVFGELYLVKPKLDPESTECSVIKKLQGYKKDDLSYEKTIYAPMSSVERERIPEAKNLEHRNIIKIMASWIENPPKGYLYDSSQRPEGSDGVLFIQMELCDLKSLRKWLDSPWKNIEDCWKILYQVALGLEYLHEVHKVAHRDIKPANILLKSIKQNGRDGVIVKIADFGLATDLKASLTGKRGTRGYRSIAIANGKTHYETQADMYSLGVIFCELIISTRNTDTDTCKKFKKVIKAEDLKNPFNPKDLRWNMTEMEMALAEKMVHDGEVAKITCREFKIELIIIQPKADEFMELWDENPFMVDVTGNAAALKRYPDIKPLKFITLTDLRLEYVEVDIARLVTSMKACKQLMNISLVIKAMSNNCSQSYEKLNLQTVKSFTFHQLNDFKGYTTVEQITSEELRDMLFFGQASLIATNSMKVKVQLQKADLIDIDFSEGNFILNGKASRFLIEEVLLGNHQNQFRVVSINNLENTSPGSPPLELDMYLKELDKLERLELHKTAFNLDYKPFFKRASKLNTLYLDGSMGDAETEVNLADFPLSLDMVTLKYFKVNLSPESKSTFNTLQLVWCNIPQDFAKLYHKTLYVSNLLTIVPSSNSKFRPDFSFVDAIFNGTWNEMRFGGFNRDLKIDDENTLKWWNDVTKNISKTSTDIKIKNEGGDAVVEEYFVQNDDCVQGNEEVKIRIQSKMTDF